MHKTFTCPNLLMVADAMPHFSPVSCTLLNVSAWIFFGSFCLTNNWLYFTQKERILFAFMPHWTAAPKDVYLLGCLGGNYGYLKRFFVSSKTVSYPNESSRTFSRHDSSELVYTEFLRRLFLKNNRNNLVIKCEKSEYFKRRKLLSRHF